MTVQRIITAKDYCRRDGVASVKERIQKIQKEALKRKRIEIRIQFDKISPRPVYARIELGQWCADCECGGVEFVDPDEPIFFCFSCGNRVDSGCLRTVVFPPAEQRKEIEALVLERPVEERRGLDELERAHMARPVIYLDTEDGGVLPLTRTWNHGEPISNLKKENEAVDQWRRASLKKIGQAPDIQEEKAGE